MTVVEIIEEYLRGHGYDGLYADDAECGCRLGDLAPCESYVLTCMAGVLKPCEPEERWWGDGNIIGPRNEAVSK